ncbi:hypothetical protein AWB89_22935 [Mycobacterium paraense]|nr:hypothetical protein AWB89_22935 [Mycobacterium paraense]
MMLMGVDSFSKQQVTSDEPVCPAIIEAAAIVEAEWMRLNPSSRPAPRVTCELPAPRHVRRPAHTLVATQRRPRALPTCGTQLRVRWPACRVWARERSPPAGA